MIGSVRTSQSLLQLAEKVGLVPVWQDVYGETHDVEESVLRSMLNILDLPCDSSAQLAESHRRLDHEALLDTGGMLVVNVNQAPTFSYIGSPIYTLTLESGKQYIGRARAAGSGKVSIRGIDQIGYHRLAIGDRQLTLAVAPPRCPSLDRRQGAWGVSAQVYSLYRSDHDISRLALPSAVGTAASVWPGWEKGGDFATLTALARHAGRAGASALAISPVHAMFTADPQRYSPYSPSSRLFLNVAYIEPSVVLGEDAVRRAAAQISNASDDAASAGSARVDWTSVVPRRLRLLRALFNDFRRQSHADTVNKFEEFRGRGGDALESHACYEALHHHYRDELGPSCGWQQWPAELHDPRGTAVKAYAAAHEEDVSFHVFLQWLADAGLRHAQRGARAAGMSAGLITDLAIGTDPRGSHAWSRQGEMLGGVSVGAPPDLYQPQGQNWGLTAFSPRALHQNGYSAFIETLRAALAHAGGVRIDHILGLARMWLIPPEAEASDGVYLRYPLNDMLRLIALEAWRHRAIVVGENLGTVPEGFNEQLERTGILGMSVLWFERAPQVARAPDIESGAELESEPKPIDPPTRAPFVDPSQWSPYAMATPSTHDLPTIHGWWAGRDLEWRRRLGQLSDDEFAQQLQERQHDKKALWHALEEAGCVPEGEADPPDMAPRDAIFSFVARTPAPLLAVSLEDLLQAIDQPNLPGSESGSDVTHPNWTQCLPVGVEEIFTDQRARQAVAAIQSARRKP
ncbi:4-alpha-glucanotransferase [Candidimonas sp. SYP-B2681]|uniref:4-alpha-glucanotransferase n=1 Tax=Candidimonas sp. SYP-B2681 TaxID=2497686 RepID=UPI000F89C29A|nr:4-alpha-glucanotransferase [Candidimonas sp. SYP-B2681]RTZ45624.1 4-alpha-glucanotransferase [Candidimonas sp. SYP-B2681]